MIEHAFRDAIEGGGIGGTETPDLDGHGRPF
jgi:hypothetical protein